MPVPIDQWLDKVRSDERAAPARSPGELTQLNEFYAHLGTRSPDDAAPLPTWKKKWDRVSQRSKASLAVCVLVFPLTMYLWNWMSRSTLVIVWPLDERKSATLEVDGRPLKLGGTESILLSGTTAPRMIRATREGERVIVRRRDR